MPQAVRWPPHLPLPADLWRRLADDPRLDPSMRDFCLEKMAQALERELAEKPRRN